MHTHQASPINLYIELLRGIAAVMVMLCHYAVFIQGEERSWLNFFYTGVDFFFVISGFVFAPTLLSPVRENFKAFAIRRIFRIYPLFLLAIFVYALLPHKSWDNGIILQHALFLHTTISKEIAFYYNPAFWSLPVEIEFYLMILALVFLKIRNSRSVLFTLSVMSIAAGLWLHYYLPDDSHAKLVLTHHLPKILPEFLLGTLAYTISRNCNILFGIFFGIAGLALLFFLGNAFVMHGDTVSHMTHGQFNLLCALGYQWIIIAGVALLRQSQHKAPFALTATFLGNLSYGVYLFHNATPHILKLFFELDGIILLAASMLATFLIAGILYAILENPMRNIGKRYASTFYQTPVKQQF